MRSKRRAPQRLPPALEEHVGCAHPPQVVHQAEHRRITHRDAIDVGDRQRKAGPLQQRPELAHIGKRRHMRRHPALNLCFGAAKLCRNSVSVSPAEERRQKKPVRLQRAADLHQRPRQIVDGVQRERRHREIEAGIGEGQRFLVGDHVQPACCALACIRDQRARWPDFGECAAQGVARCAEIDRNRESAARRRAAVRPDPASRVRRRNVTGPSFRARSWQRAGACGRKSSVRRTCCSLSLRADEIEPHRSERYGSPMIDEATGRAARHALPWRCAACAHGARHVLDLGLPPLCPTCREPVADQGAALCAMLVQSCRSSHDPIASAWESRLPTIPGPAFCPWKRSPTRRPITARARRSVTMKPPAPWCRRLNMATGSISHPPWGVGWHRGA